MNLLEILKIALAGEDPRPPQPAVAEITIISSESVNSSSETPSAQARD